MFHFTLSERPTRNPIFSKMCSWHQSKRTNQNFFSREYSLQQPCTTQRGTVNVPEIKFCNVWCFHWLQKCQFRVEKHHWCKLRDAETPAGFLTHCVLKKLTLGPSSSLWLSIESPVSKRGCWNANVASVWIRNRIIIGNFGAVISSGDKEKVSFSWSIFDFNYVVFMQLRFMWRIMKRARSGTGFNPSEIVSLQAFWFEHGKMMGSMAAESWWCLIAYSREPFHMKPFLHFTFVPHVIWFLGKHCRVNTLQVNLPHQIFKFLCEHRTSSVSYGWWCLNNRWGGVMDGIVRIMNC